MKSLSVLKCLIIIFFWGSIPCYGGVVHKSHDHGHHDHKNLNKERESDGAYSPKDRDHFDESEYETSMENCTAAIQIDDCNSISPVFDYTASPVIEKYETSMENCTAAIQIDDCNSISPVFDYTASPVIENGPHNDFDHEAILGSVKEADEYDHLPPEEAKKRLAVLVTKMDLSKDGYIDRNELKAWILRSFRMLSEEEATEKLEDADENQDGKLSWTEYLSDTYGVDSDEDDSLKFHEENLHLINEDQEMWKAADKNGDDVLDFQEWLVFSNPEEHPDMLPIILQQTLKNKDKDNDSSISFQEFIGDHGIDLNKENLEGEKFKFDEEYDKDKDGKLTGSEILSWVVPSNDEIADDEVTHLFAHSDDDHDDLLSFEEIIDHHEVFVGSEVTDYGDHLHNLHQFDDEL